MNDLPLPRYYEHLDYKRAVHIIHYEKHKYKKIEYVCAEFLPEAALLR